MPRGYGTSSATVSKSIGGNSQPVAGTHRSLCKFAIDRANRSNDAGQTRRASRTNEKQTVFYGRAKNYLTAIPRPATAFAAGPLLPLPLPLLCTRDAIKRCAHTYVSSAGR